MIHLLQCNTVDCGGGLGRKQRGAVQDRARRIQTLAVVNIHRTNNPGIHSWQRHQRHGLRSVCDELIGEVCVGLANYLSPAKHVLLFGAREGGEGRSQRCRGIARILHELKRSLEARLDLASGHGRPGHACFFAVDRAYLG